MEFVHKLASLQKAADGFGTATTGGARGRESEGQQSSSESVMKATIAYKKEGHEQSQTKKEVAFLEFGNMEENPAQTSSGLE